MLFINGGGPEAGKKDGAQWWNMPGTEDASGVLHAQNNSIVIEICLIKP